MLTRHVRKNYLCFWSLSHRHLFYAAFIAYKIHKTQKNNQVGQVYKSTFQVRYFFIYRKRLLRRHILQRVSEVLVQSAAIHWYKFRNSTKNNILNSLFLVCSLAYHWSSWRLTPTPLLLLSPWLALWIFVSRINKFTNFFFSRPSRQLLVYISVANDNESDRILYRVSFFAW